MTLPHFGFEHFEVEVAGPSHGGIGTLSRSIGVPQISKMFALVLQSLATNQLKSLSVAWRIGVSGSATGYCFLVGAWPLLAGPFVFVVAHLRKGCSSPSIQSDKHFTFL
jgi:hypothetical protein